MPLVDNARRYARDRGARRARGRRAARAARRARRRTGRRPRARRSRVRSRRARRGDDHAGAGLGLPLARRLARSCGGDVRLAPGPHGASCSSCRRCGARRRPSRRSRWRARPGPDRRGPRAAPSKGLRVPDLTPERNFVGGRRFPAPDAARRLRPPHARPRRRAARRRDARRRPLTGPAAHRRAVRARVRRGLPRGREGEDRRPGAAARHPLGQGHARHVPLAARCAGDAAEAIEGGLGRARARGHRAGPRERDRPRPRRPALTGREGRRAPRARAAQPGAALARPAARGVLGDGHVDLVHDAQRGRRSLRDRGPRTCRRREHRLRQELRRRRRLGPVRARARLAPARAGPARLRVAVRLRQRPRGRGAPRRRSRGRRRRLPRHRRRDPLREQVRAGAALHRHAALDRRSGLSRWA